MALGPTQPSIQWIPGGLSLGVKRQGREANTSSPVSGEVKKMLICTSAPPYSFMASYLIKHRRQLYLYLVRRLFLLVYVSGGHGNCFGLTQSMEHSRVRQIYVLSLLPHPTSLRLVARQQFPCCCELPITCNPTCAICRLLLP
jgi:hypothetical protein